MCSLKSTMKFIVYLLLVAARCNTLLGALTGEPRVPEARIVGGHEAKPHSHPYMVSLQMRFIWLRMHICGGSLLNENWVLTAAHCIKESWIIRWLPMDAVAGAHNVENYGPKAQVVAVSKRIAHPQYEGGVGPHDIAVLRTSTPFTFTPEVQPVQLPFKDLKNNDFDSLSLSGWGALKTTAFFPDLPTRLQEVEVKYIPYDKCYDAIEDIREDEENPLDKNANICTGPITGGIAACNGDSGGPLVYIMPNENEEETTTVANEQRTTVAKREESEDSSSEYYDIDIGRNIQQNDNSQNSTPVLLGVVSWGISPCGDKGAPTVYTKVSSYLDFINKTIN